MSTGSGSPVLELAPVLELEGVRASYGPYRALFGVSLSVPAGAAVALVGANGAGKSTVARVVSGLVPVTAGSVRFDGVDIAGCPTYEIARKGLTHVTEGRSVFGTLTVEENLVLPFRRALGRAGVPGALARAYAAFPRLGERSSQSAATLSGGEQRMLALARALVVEQRLLVVDELSLGLAPAVVDEVYAGLAQVLARGTAVLLIEQHVDRALQVADSVVVLSKGSVVYDGDVDGAAPHVSDLMAGHPPG